MTGNRQPAQPKRQVKQVTLYALLAGILILAAVLRFWRLGAISFTYDAAAISNLAARVVDTGELPLQGMVSSTGIRNPPLGVILLSLPVLFSRDPAVLAGFVILLNVAGVYGTYWLGRRYWSPGVGLLAALLFAVSPWAVRHSRGILGQDMLIPGVVLLFVFLFSWLVDGKQWALSAALVTISALTQIHFAALALVPVLAFLLLWQILHCLHSHEPVPFWRHLAIGASIAALLYVPYLVADAQSGWENVRGLLDLTQQPYQLHRQALDLMLMAIGGRNIHSIAGPVAYRQFIGQVIDPGYRLDRLEEFLVIAAFVYLAVRLVQHRANARLFSRDALLLLWLAGPFLFFLVSRSDVYPHYIVVVYSAPYLLLAAACHDVLSALGNRRRFRLGLVAVGGAVLAVVVAWQAFLVVSLRDFVDSHDTPSGSGTPVRILRDVVRTSKQLAALNAPSDVVMLCSGSEPRWDECPAVFSFLSSRGPAVSFIDYNDPKFRIHQGDAETLMVLAPGSSLAADELPHLAREVPAAAVPLRQNQGAYRFFEIRNPYRDIARYIDTAAGPTDAIVLVGPGQRQALARYYQGPLPIYELPMQPMDEDATIQQLLQLTRQHRRLYALYRSDEESDPKGLISGWLRTNTYTAVDRWLGPVRLVTNVAPSSVNDWRIQKPAAGFEGQIELGEVAWAASAAEAGDMLPVRLEWRALAQPGADYTLFAQLLDEDGQVWAQRDVPLIDEGRLASAWQSGQEATTLLGLTIPPGTPPATYRLILGLYNTADGKRLKTNGLDLLDLGGVPVKRSSVPAVAAVLGMRFRPNFAFPEITLIGHEHYKKEFAHAPDTPLSPGDTLRLVFMWQSQAQPSENWMATTRLVSPNGTTAATVTAPLASGRYPSLQWTPGEVVRGEHDLLLPATLKPGRYQLQLAVHRDDTRSPGQWVDLGPLAVQ